MPPTALLELITRTAQEIGARPQSDHDVTVAAKAAVAFVVAKVEEMRQSGGLRQVNAAYRRYRLAQVAKGEPAMNYAAHMAAFTRSMVEKVAAQR